MTVHRTVLSLTDVSFAYERTLTIDGVSFSVRPGEIVGLVGPNGSGKTTVLRLCAGLVAPLHGTIVAGNSPGMGTPVSLRSMLAFAPDNPHGFEHLRISEFFRLYAALQHADEGYLTRASTLGEVCRLPTESNSLIDELSHGNRRKVSIVAAAALVRPLTLIDEATSALDPEAIIALESLISGLSRRGCAVLLATQDIFFAERSCDTVGILVHGRIIDFGPPSTLARRAGAEDLRGAFVDVLAYGEEADRIDTALSAVAG